MYVFIFLTLVFYFEFEYNLLEKHCLIQSYKSRHKFKSLYIFRILFKYIFELINELRMFDSLCNPEMVHLLINSALIC